MRRRLLRRQRSGRSSTPSRRNKLVGKPKGQESDWGRVLDAVPAVALSVLRGEITPPVARKDGDIIFGGHAATETKMTVSGEVTKRR